MSCLYGLTFQLEEPTPNIPTKVINIMVDEEGEKYINYLHQQLKQKENIIKEVRECIDNFTLEKLDGFEKYKMTPLKDTWIGCSILEILDKK